MKPDINKLLKQLEQHPNDDKLLAKIALHYIENPEGNKDLEYLEEAYQANPSIENTHNLAFWLYHEYGDENRSLELQRQALLLQPKSYYPYASYILMLTFDVGYTDDSYLYKHANQYDSVIEYCLTALEKFYAASAEQHKVHQLLPVNIFNNIACTYVMLDKYQEASKYFVKALQELEDIKIDSNKNTISQSILDEKKYNISLNQVRLQILIGNLQKTVTLLIQLEKNAHYDNLDIANLYARAGMYDIACEIIPESAMDDSWELIWYAIYNADKDRWYRMKKAMLDDEIKYLSESKIDAEKYRLENRLDLFEEENEAIEYLKNIINNRIITLEADSISKPDSSIKTEFSREFFGCLLFGCSLHNSLLSDSIS
ncbi:hypothetical protein KPY62_06630 [Psychrobacter sp. TAE2020]|uniref:hypothetical protein n=1 Tax=Psychrobacter sp. TAE2020 TaxID=2846762 RepID=UPI001C10A6BF|nr:hypothetical protein [Psychrobacter sp. TAE2020]MBU5616772.1 hypothetical protein [Psychrobacter sp. TAE2020]